MILLTLLAASASVSPVLVKVDGEGYLRFIKDGHVVYARSAKLGVDASGKLAFEGAEVLPGIEVPSGGTGLSIDLSGTVSIKVQGASVVIGHLVLARPTSAQSAQGSGDFFTFSDRPALSEPGDGDTGVIRVVSAVSTPIATPVVRTQSEQRASMAVIQTNVAAASVKSSTKETSRPQKLDGRLQIVFHDKTEVSKDSFTFADIADISGPEDLKQKVSEIKVGNTTIVGSTRIIDARLLRTRLIGADIPVEKCVLVMGDSIQVARKAQELSSDQFRDAALKVIQEKFPSATNLVLAQPIKPATVKDGAIDWITSDPTQNENGYSVTISVKLGGSLEATRSVTLTAGEKIQGCKLNELVNVTLHCPGMSVQCTGKAKSAALVGGKVEVLITGIGEGPTTQIGVVTAPGQVTVEV